MRRNYLPTRKKLEIRLFEHNTLYFCNHKLIQDKFTIHYGPDFGTQIFIGLSIAIIMTIQKNYLFDGLGGFSFSLIQLFITEIILFTSLVF
ncbi:uncharacterized protein BX664DRAFT_80307 [Halteromyces radiatus]|uniref:uncharacterized protein n=1 Tax=Halteromyces radiatus TaxID=101107 RepID=UPI00221EA051|nr:uncharacterized protein BX664DRAFT_80307 [Halteromyces radiatus]KAI8097450.1 hypothetical protein BX664DRAFT_80307 [Halteromyces radiatus]